jgi:hypothetical protein
MPDGMADKLSAGPDAPRTRHRSPRELLRDLAEHSTNESARVSATRALIELDQEAKERRDAAKETSNPFAELTDGELYRMIDAETAGTLTGILQLVDQDQGGGKERNRIVTRERYPHSFKVVETTLERIAEQQVGQRVREALAANESAAEFERRVEQAARRRADAIVEARMATMRAQLGERARREAAGAEVAAVEPVAEVPEPSGPIWIDQEAPSPALSVLG